MEVHSLSSVFGNFRKYFRFVRFAIPVVVDEDFDETRPGYGDSPFRV